MGSNIFFVMRKYGWFEEAAWEGADDVLEILKEHPDYEAMIKNLPRLLEIDFSALREPRADYADQVEISKERVDMLAACAVHYDLDFGLVIRYMAAEYTADWRDTEAILEAVKDLISDADYEHMKRILEFGCPAEFNWDEPAENKMIFLRRGNHPSIKTHMPIVTKTLNKEERNSHVVPFPRYFVFFSPYARTTPQTVVNPNHPDKKARLCWDGTTIANPHEISMNQVTPTVNEAEVTFGYVHLYFCIWIWNLRITYPDSEIWLAFIDISSCFRWPRIFPCLAAAFGFIIGPLFYAANAMVFGSVVSSSSWEPFRRAISALAESFHGQTDLIKDHHEYIDMLKWEELPHPSNGFTRATACSQNKGILDENGVPRKTPHFIYVDDNLMADILSRMNMTLAAAIQTIFVVMGFPALAFRQCAVAMDKWSLLVVSPIQVLLGLLFNSRDMTVSVTPKYRLETLELLETTWANRESFYINELEVLIGKIGRMAQAYRPLYFMMGMLYASSAFALRENDEFLQSTHKGYRKLVAQAKQNATTEEDAREIKFAIKEAARMKHHSKRRYRLPKSLKEEIVFLRKILQANDIRFSTPIAHIVPRDYLWETAADSCKSAGGGWSTDLKFWWHLVYPAEVLRRARLKNNKGGLKISINVLEFVCVIINFAAVIYICDADDIDLSDYPVLLNWCDNTAACAWANHKCKYSLIGRRLGRFFVGLLMGTKIGVQQEWISTHLNTIADDISRLTENKKNEFDYEKLTQTYPILNDCRQFQASDTLLGMIWDIVLHNACPDPLTIMQLEPAALGRIIS